MAHYRKSSAKRYSKGRASPQGGGDGPRISIEEVDSAITEEGDPVRYEETEGPADENSEEGYQSDSSSSEEDEDEFVSATQKLFVEGNNLGKSLFAVLFTLSTHVLEFMS